MKCDVDQMLCLPPCEYRNGCGPHRPNYPRAEDMTASDRSQRTQWFVQRGRLLSLGKNLPHWLEGECPYPAPKTGEG